ncbi:MAG: FAD-dependent oxidoreductase [Planctomycetes bacterium]|nr:FAD-dependent oxidoreductase [Planctomycetota bacterium]
MPELLEIRLHGRGGQGGVTCAKIIAAAYASLQKSVQTFGDYAGERSGAPVRAYTRVSDAPITDRNKVYEPDQLVVLDPHLLGPEVFAGLKPGGSALINTPQSPDALAARWGAFTIATVDATRIAREHKIGSRSVVIVNTTIAGAYARVHGISLDVLRKTYAKLGLLGNFAAAEAAHAAVTIRPAHAAASPAVASGKPRLPDVLSLEAHVASPPPALKTGNWSTQRPRYQEQLAPCSAWCPAGNDVVGFVRALASGDAEQGATILGRSTPLAAVCGRVCPAPCMDGCNRAEYDGAVNIRALERFVAGQRGVASRAAAPSASSRRFAVIGGGPAGLSAAYQLARRGHAVTIFEGERALGGVLRTGIPSYRLPRDVLDEELGDVLALGVEVRSGRFLTSDDVARLAGEHDGLILATGLQELRGLEVEGADLAGVEQGIRFLHRVNLEGNVALEGHVVVLGGGNTAMDCARSALRCGASRVTIAYRRTRAEMPAIKEEIEQAEEEGVTLMELRAPSAFLGDGRVRAVELREVELGEPDASGRRQPMVTERRATLECDQVLLALGQSADHRLLPAGWELRDGRVLHADKALPVFAAGDLATGDGTVTHAIGSGRRAADLALEALGIDVVPFERPDRERAVPATEIRFDHFTTRSPAFATAVAAAIRRTNFAEVDPGLRSSFEANRCFSCGHCTRCDTCLVYCPEGIVRRADAGYEVDYSYCKGCGICVTECPRSAMEMTDA